MNKLATRQPHVIARLASIGALAALLLTLGAFSSGGTAHAAARAAS